MEPVQFLHSPLFGLHCEVGLSKTGMVSVIAEGNLHRAILLCCVCPLGILIRRARIILYPCGTGAKLKASVSQDALLSALLN